MPDLTSPTYTIAVDTPLDPSCQKAWYVSALGGTQNGVEIQNAANPFQLVIAKPKAFKLPSASVLDTAGFVANAPVNEYKLITRKGVKLNGVGGSARVLLETRFVVPVNSPNADLANCQAALSLHTGAIWQNPTQFWTMINTNVL